MRTYLRRKGAVVEELWREVLDFLDLGFEWFYFYYLLTRALPAKSAFVTVPSLDFNSPLRPLEIPNPLLFALLLASYPVPPNPYKTNNGWPSLVNIWIGSSAFEPVLGRTKAVAAAEAVLLLQELIFIGGGREVEGLATDELEDEEDEQLEPSLDGFGKSSADGNIVRGY